MNKLFGWVSGNRRNRRKHRNVKTRTNFARLRVEELESRLTPSAVYNAATDVVTIRGTAGADIIRVELDDTTPTILRVFENNSATPSLELDTTTNPVDHIFVSCGNGNDTVSFAPNVIFDAVVAGDGGNDTIITGLGDDQVKGGLGNDMIVGGAGDDILDGGRGNDKLDGGDDADTVGGSIGDDIVHGGDGNDNLVSGGSGKDFIVGGDGTDNLHGGSGIDTFISMTTGEEIGSDFNEDREFKLASFADAGLFGTRTDPANLDINDEDNRDHAPAGPTAVEDAPVDYTTGGHSNPPTWGMHDVTPLATDIYTTVQDDADLVHNLEHGHVWISYDPDLVTAAQVEQLEEIVRSFGLDNGVIITPRHGTTSTGQAEDAVVLPGPAIAVASWGRLMTLTTVDLVKIVGFILTNRGHAPEGFATP